MTALDIFILLSILLACACAGLAYYAWTEHVKSMQQQIRAEEQAMWADHFQAEAQISPWNWPSGAARNRLSLPAAMLALPYQLRSLPTNSAPLNAKEPRQSPRLLFMAVRTYRLQRRYPFAQMRHRPQQIAQQRDPVQRLARRMLLIPDPAP